MKIFKNKVFVFSLIVALLITCGIAGYYIFISIEREASIDSFDNRVTLTFGKAKIGKISYDSHYKYIQFKTRDDVLINKIRNSEYIIASNVTATYADYLLAYRGYFFWISSMDEIEFVKIYNSFASVFIDNTPDHYVPFLLKSTQLSFYSYEKKSNFITWDSMSFSTKTLVSNFESLANMYKKLDDYYVREINLEDQFIILNCSQMNYGDMTIDEDIVLKIKGNDEGIDFEVVYLINGN
ncbi:MAG: hypothetical protein LBF68_06620 [Christensenellaceae bacterium]|jgi:hypothetical protein|nr:hypothetical protein [Christensenellaceae bacterium]